MLIKTLHTSSHQAQWFQVRFVLCIYVSSKEREVSSLAEETLSKKKKEAKTKNDLKTKELLDLIPNLQDEIAYLRKVLDLKEDKLQRHTEDLEIFKSLHKQGFIDQNGNPIQE